MREPDTARGYGGNLLALLFFIFSVSVSQTQDEFEAKEEPVGQTLVMDKYLVENLWLFLGGGHFIF